MAEKSIRVVADVAALRAVGTISKAIMYFVLSTGAIYKWDATSSAADEGDQVVKSPKYTTGRFLRMQGDQTTEPGQKAVNVYRLASNVADAETITIGADVYEFKTSGSAGAGHIKVDASGGVTPTLMSTALVAAIIASATEKVTAVRISANEILLIATNPGAVTIACTSTLAGANNAWAAAAMYGGRAGGIRKFSVQKRVPTAAEVALGNMHFAFDFVPAVAICFVTVTATPDLAVAHDGGVTIDNTNKKITVDNAGSTDWTASHTLSVLALA